MLFVIHDFRLAYMYLSLLALGRIGASVMKS